MFVPPAYAGNLPDDWQVYLHLLERSLAETRAELENLRRDRDGERLLREGIELIQGIGIEENKSSGFERIKQSADLGNRLSQRRLGDLILKGIVSPSYLTMAAHYYKLAADQGDSICQRKYGNCLLNGTGVPQDIRTARTFYKMSADKGDAAGQRNYAISILREYQSHPIASRYLRSAAKAGDRVAQYLYGRRRLAAGESGAMTYVRKSAEKGFAPAQTLLAVSLLHGTGGLKRNIPDGQAYLEAACKKGDIFAQMFRGYFYETGMNGNFEKSLDKAEECYRTVCDQMQRFDVERHGLIYAYIFKQSAADLLDHYRDVLPFRCSRGYWSYLYGLLHERKVVDGGADCYKAAANAENSYGKFACAEKAENKEPLYEESIAKQNTWGMVSYGHYLEHSNRRSEAELQFRRAAESGNPEGKYRYSLYLDDVKQIRQLLYDAAEQGHSDAQFRYADLLMKTDANDQTLIRYAKEAADQGHAGAQVMYGKFLYDGIRCEKSFEEAAFYFRRAAMQGNPDGEYEYAQSLLNGEGVEQNEELGNTFLQKAAEHGSAQAEAALRRD